MSFLQIYFLQAAWSFSVSAGVLTKTPSFRHRALRLLAFDVRSSRSQASVCVTCTAHAAPASCTVGRDPGLFTRDCADGDADIAQVASMGIGRGAWSTAVHRK